MSGLAIGAMMPVDPMGGGWLISAAWADDHTDDDDGDDLGGDDDDDDRVIRRARPRATQAAPRRARAAVSYTHLTLPTKRIG